MSESGDFRQVFPFSLDFRRTLLSRTLVHQTNSASFLVPTQVNLARIQIWMKTALDVGQGLRWLRDGRSRRSSRRFWRGWRHNLPARHFSVRTHRIGGSDRNV